MGDVREGAKGTTVKKEREKGSVGWRYERNDFPRQNKRAHSEIPSCFATVLAGKCRYSAAKCVITVTLHVNRKPPL
jgi:hypothetical protein